MSSTTRPDEGAVIAFLEGDGVASLSLEVSSHFDECDECRNLLVGLARATMADDRREGGGDVAGREPSGRHRFGDAHDGARLARVARLGHSAWR
jgi:hypothetical protein